MEGADLLAIQVNEQSMVVQDHHVVHIIRAFKLVESWPIDDIVLRFVDFDESSTDEFDTTLKFEDVCTKGSPLNLIAYVPLM
jgi:hypothetical protein